MTTSSPVLEVRNLSVSLPAGGDRPFAIKDVSFDLRVDEVLCFVGESGSGKSILARAVMGLLPGPEVAAAAGEILFEGEDLLLLSDQRMRGIRGSRIAIIFQEPMTALNPLMTIGNQIDEVMRIHTDLSRKQRRDRVLAILEDVRLPEPQAVYEAYPHQLSGGQRQRALIAMSLVLDPRIIIADEPTTALDVTTQAQILGLIAEIQQKHGTALLFITHDFGVVAEIADRIVVMQHGEVREAGVAEDVLNQPQDDYTRTLIGAVPGLSAKAEGARQGGRSILEASGLKKTFVSGGGMFGGNRREVVAVNNVGLVLRRGETLGIVGESGSGKSTLARLIIRLIRPDSGHVALDGEDFLAFSGRELRAQRRRVQMIFQDPFASLNPRYTVRRIVTEGMLLRGITTDAASMRLLELLALVGLDESAAERYPHQFSGGQRQRIGIARALALEPEVLIADEAVSALDVSVQEQVLRLLAEIRDRFELAMLFITHDLCVAAEICDNIVVMRRGEVVESGTTAELFNVPKHDYTRSLLDAIPGKSWISSLERKKLTV